LKFLKLSWGKGNMPAEVVSQIENIFRPRSIAVIGVSDKRYRLGNLLLSSFKDIGFKGDLYPVNPQENQVMGLRCYPSVKEIEGPVDLVIISVHPNGVSALIDDCVAKGIRAAVIFSSGFREKSEEGSRAEAEIVQKARRGGVRILGPNCMGLYSPSSGLSFFPGMPKELGTIAFLSQSGSLTNLLGLFGGVRGVRFSKMISVGNSADLGVNDFLEYLGQDPETRLIVLYLEGLEDGRRFISLARNISPKKPILLWKGGKTEGGRKAAGSHTGSLSGSEELWEAAIRQSGIIKVENLIELLGFVTAFQSPYFPAGNRVAILSGPGGPAVSASDACEKEGLRLARLSRETESKLAEFVPEFGASITNPVDLSLASSMDLSLYPRATELCGLDENVDMIVEYISVLRKEVMEGIIRAQEKVRKPMAIITFMEYTTMTSPRFQLFGSITREELTELLMRMYASGISVHATEQEAARVLSSLLKYKKYIDSRHLL
jgi:acetyl-CoA synthetase (ADP-forming)